MPESSISQKDIGEGAYLAPSLRSCPMRNALESAIFDVSADRATTALIAWETPTGEFKFRTIPNSPSLVIGMHEMLGRAIDAMSSSDGEDDSDD